MNRKLGLVAVVVVLAGLTFTWKGVSRPCAAQEAPRARAQITQPIDEKRLIPLAGNTRREANANTDRGPVPDDFPMEHMLLLLKRPPELEQEFEQYIESLTDKSSPNFHQWLLPDQQGQMYGLAQEDLDIVTAWLESHGFTVGYVYPTRRVIDFSGTAGEIREAFHTEIHYVDVRGEQHFANMSDPKIPEALAPFVLGVASMHNFKPHAYLVPRTQYHVTSGSGGTYDLVVPADVQTIYNLTPVYRQGIYGQGQTIVVVEDAMPWSTDPSTYQSTFNLGVFGGSWSNTHPNAGGNCTSPASPNADEGEANIDVEIALAVAPGAAIQAASCSDTATFGGLLAIENLVSAGSPPSIISMSYGECEALNTQGGNAAFYSAFQSAAAAGVSVFASSGDSLSSLCSGNEGLSYGAYGVGVTGWGSTPYNVAVGGTDFEDSYNSGEGGPAISTYWSASNSPTDGNAKSYIPEIPWNDSCASWLLSNYATGSGATYGASGFCNSTIASEDDLHVISGGSGGPSGCANGASTSGYVTTGCAGYAKPSWQAGIFGNPADGVRDLPDVSLFAGNGTWGHFYVICWSDTANYGVGGRHGNQGAVACTNPPNPLASTPTWSGFGGTSFAAPMMAAMQALVNQKWGIRAGNPNPTYYAIANTEFGLSGNSACYSINQPPPRGLASSCVFYDITQGDIDAVCRENRSATNCYDPSGTYGVLSTGQVSAVSVIQGGSGYTSAPTCTLDAPATSTDYLSPTGGTIYAGGTQAGTCTAHITGGSVTSITFTASGAGYAGGSGCTLSGGGGSGATCAAEVSITTAPTAYAPAFYATPGWDFATGIGTVNAYNLVFNTAW
jgi:subtilase family serine protease